jgi:hypothetical protein
MSYRLIREEERKARKPHSCIWCAQPIQVGERYVFERSVYEDRMQNHHWHPECLEDMHAVASHEGGPVEWTPGANERPARVEALEAFHAQR